MASPLGNIYGNVIPEPVDSNLMAMSVAFLSCCHVAPGTFLERPVHIDPGSNERTFIARMYLVPLAFVVVASYVPLRFFLSVFHVAAHLMRQLCFGQQHIAL